MSFINNLKIKYKLVLMLIFPLLGLLYFSVNIMIEKTQTTMNMEGLAELTLLSTKISHIAHAVQLERGASSLFLKNQGKKFSKELSQYRNDTDKSVTALHGFLQDFDANRYDASFKTRLDSLLETLTGFPIIRTGITTLDISQPQAVKRYTKINQSLFQFLIQSTHYSSYKEIFPMKLAYFNLLQAKEKAGLERALLSAIFSQQSLGLGQFQQFVALVSAQKAYLNHDVMNYLTKEQKNFLKKQLSAGAVIEETDKMREMVYIANAANDVLQSEIDPEYWFNMQTGKINLLKEAGDKIANDLYLKAVETNSAAHIDFIGMFSIMLVIICLVIAFLVTILMDVTSRLDQAVKIANKIANGELNNKFEIEYEDEIGQLSQAFVGMQTQLRERITTSKQIAAEALRINCALDSSPTSVLIADNNYRIIYVNDAAQRLFKTFENNIRQQLPRFNANNLLNAYIDVLYQNPTQQRQVIADLTSTHHASLPISGLTINTVITPVIDSNDERLGTVFEFIDNTVKIATEQEINTVIQAASVGNFNERIELGNKTGFFKTISESINQIMELNQRAIDDIMHITAALAEGNLLQKMENDYIGAFEQLKHNINTTVQKLTEVMTVISTSAVTVNDAANDLFQGNASLSNRTKQQAISLEETAASMEQMTSSIQQSADNTKQASYLANSAKELAEKGSDAVDVTVLAMTEITTSSRKITDITGVINDIAFQTNLLALNAAVEAARAGEYGRGFAVVAAEVRNLAQRSAAAAKEIKQLIDNSVYKVEDGTKLANKSGDTLREIFTAVKQVSVLITEIAASNQEQSTGIQQVTQTILQMDDMTQKNANLVEEATAASNALKVQAQSLKEQVAFFNTGKTILSQTNDQANKNSNNQESTKSRALIAPLPYQNDDDEWKEF